MSRRCKDCKAEGVESIRKAPHPGPRCATHHRAKKRQDKRKARANRLEKVYGITEEEYAELYEYQGGTCYICQRATGKTKRLSVDHDHETGYVRGLLCSHCNKAILGHLRDDPEGFQRGIDYLANPPAFSVIGKRKVPEN